MQCRENDGSVAMRMSVHWLVGREMQKHSWLGQETGEAVNNAKQLPKFERQRCLVIQS